MTKSRESARKKRVAVGLAVRREQDVGEATRSRPGRTRDLPRPGLASPTPGRGGRFSAASYGGQEEACRLWRRSGCRRRSARRRPGAGRGSPPSIRDEKTRTSIFARRRPKFRRGEIAPPPVKPSGAIGRGAPPETSLRSGVRLSRGPERPRTDLLAVRETRPPCDTRSHGPGSSGSRPARRG